MSHVIRIPTNIYNRLEKHAQGFDTPANVIERLLNSYEGGSKQPLESNDKNTKDITKYIFKNSIYGKSRLVHAVIREYIVANPETSYSELKHIFPPKTQGSIGVFNHFEYVENKYKDKANKRHFIKDAELIQLSDCKVAICTEWGVGNINAFIKAAQSINYEIEASNNG